MFMEFMINVNVEKCLGCKKNWRKTTTKKRLRGGKKLQSGFLVSNEFSRMKILNQNKKKGKRNMSKDVKNLKFFFADIHWKLLGLKTAL